MENDKQLLHHLYWLKMLLEKDFTGKDYEQVITTSTPLSEETQKEIDALVTHIKLNY